VGESIQHSVVSCECRNKGLGAAIFAG
jgi:hypothetical protein